MRSVYKQISQALAKFPGVFLALVKVGLPAILALVLGYHLLFWDRVYPGVKIAGEDFSGLTQKQAQEKVAAIVEHSQPFSLISQDLKFPLDDLKIKYDAEGTVQQAFFIGRHGNLLTNSSQKWAALLRVMPDMPFSFSYDENTLNQFADHLSIQLTRPAVEPTISIQDGQVFVNPGKKGQEVNKRMLKQKILEGFAFAKDEDIAIPFYQTGNELTDQEAKELQEKAEKLLGREIHITFENQVFKYKDDEIIQLVDITGARAVPEQIASLVSTLATGVNRSPQNARFEFEGGRVKEFAPAVNGIEVDKKATSAKIAEALETLETTDQKTVSFELPVKTTQPEIPTEAVNDLGIKELIGHGSSRFVGSIQSRLHNIGLAANRLNGVLVKPGEEFSFNSVLGDVSVYTGYQQAYVIKDGKTILGDGGGVCQVSTTLFRAILNAGLSVSERVPHSYRVSYYEQDGGPGIDATIYSPSPDLKFKNDTPEHILIQTKLDTKNMTLVFDFYGTSDGRISEVSKQRVWDIKQPPPALYQDDPTLPAGQTKQIERAVNGAKVSFDYKVTRNGEVLQNRTFYSNYRAWQAVYLRGTASQ